MREGIPPNSTSASIVMIKVKDTAPMKSVGIVPLVVKVTLIRSTIGDTQVNILKLIKREDTATVDRLHLTSTYRRL